MSALDWDAVELALHTWIKNASGITGKRVIWSGRGAARPDDTWISLQLSIGERGGIGDLDVEANPFTFAPKTAIAVPLTSQITITAHGFAVGDGPVQLATTGTAPGGTAIETDYWAVPVDVDHTRLATSFARAIADIPTTLTITSAGTGTLTVVDTEDTVRAGAEIRQVVRAWREASLSVQCYGTTSTGSANPMAVLLDVAESSQLPSIRNALDDAGVGVVTISEIRPIGAVINTTTFEPRAQMDVKLWLSTEVSETDTIITSVDVEIDTNRAAGGFAFEFAGPLGGSDDERRVSLIFDVP